VTVAPDGTLFVSDDTHNVIYHIWYRGWEAGLFETHLGNPS